MENYLGMENLVVVKVEDWAVEVPVEVGKKSI